MHCWSPWEELRDKLIIIKKKNGEEKELRTYPVFLSGSTLRNNEVVRKFVLVDLF